jgi:transposase
MLFFPRLAPCLTGMQACARARCRRRELAQFGHELRLIPPACVKPLVRRGKTDVAGAEAICTAVTQPTMRFVPVKAAAQKAVLMQNRTRVFPVRQPTQPAKAIRAHLGAFGLVASKGVHTMGRPVCEAEAAFLPSEAQEGTSLADQRTSSACP